MLALKGEEMGNHTGRKYVVYPKQNFSLCSKKIYKYGSFSERKGIPECVRRKEGSEFSCF